jgi:cellulose synthase/poly-beta-1,6-N-acetylglucosamine synthase-like glycosyltransferase
VPRLSIIIPFSGGPEYLENTLVSVLQNRPGDCEVLVVHHGAYDDPYQLQDEVRFVEVSRTTDVIGAMNAGFEAAQGELLHVLECGAEVEEGWADAALRNFDDPQVGAVSPLVLRSTDGGRMALAGVGYQIAGKRQTCAAAATNESPQPPAANVVGPSLIAAFYRREAVTRCGGFSASVGEELTDVDFALSLQDAGYRCVFESGSRVSTVQPYRTGISQFRAGRFEELLFWRHAAEIGLLRSLALHGLLLTVEGASVLLHPTRLAKLLGRAFAWMELAGKRRQYKSVAGTNRPPATSNNRARPRRIDSAHACNEAHECSVQNAGPSLQ